MDRDEYKEYLSSNEWKEKRKEFLENQNYECERCGEYAVQVHHKNYDNLGDEDEDDVECLCYNCHMEDIHEIEDGYGEY